MTQVQQPEALRLAAICETKGMFPVADELNRMHARIVELEQGKCLHQIAEPAAQSEGEAFQALSELTNALRERHYGRMPAEVQAAYDKAWTIVFTGEKSAPAAPQAVQPAVPEGLEKREDWIGLERPGTKELIDVMHMRGVYAIPIKDREPIMRCIAKDALAEVTRLKALISAPAHPAEGVPAPVPVVDALQSLIEAIQFSPLGILQIKAMERARAALAATQPAAQGLDAQLAKLTTAYKELSSMFHDQVVAQQAAWIEWKHGNGAEDAMQWIENGLCGPGHIPDEDEPYGKEAQAWFDANKSDPIPVCACGRPSNTFWMGHGFCSEAHYDEFRAAQAKQGEQANG